MATITNVAPAPSGFGVHVSWTFDCGHTDELFYGGEEFARLDEYVASKTECIRCENHRMVEHYRAQKDEEQNNALDTPK